MKYHIELNSNDIFIIEFDVEVNTFTDVLDIVNNHLDTWQQYNDEKYPKGILARIRGIKS